MLDQPRWVMFLASQQDYSWFLNAILWGVVATAAWRLPQLPTNQRHRLLWLALALMSESLIELGATAQAIKPPRPLLDGLLGAVASIGYAGLLQREATRRGVAWDSLAWVGLAVGCAFFRWLDPLFGGLAWVTFGLCCVVLFARLDGQFTQLKPEAKKPWLTLVISLIMALALSPVGPLAYALLSGRQDASLSGFVVGHSLLLLVAAVSALVVIWHTGPGRLREWFRALRAAWWILTVWLGVGFLLLIWRGAEVRHHHNARLAQHARTAAALLDRSALQQCLSEEFRLGEVVTFYQPEGWPVHYSQTPFARTEPFNRIRAQLQAIEKANPDADFIHVLTVRDGLLAQVATHADTPENAHLVGLTGRVTPEDLTSLRSPEVTVRGPELTSWGAIVTVRAPVFIDETQPALGWLVMQYRFDIWQAAQAVDRFVIMGLVALGIVLWGMAVAYRLRAFEREEALRQAGAAAEADRVKTMFLAKVSHELRTPLQTILGNAELALQDATAPDARNRLLAIRSQGTLLHQIVNDLLDLSAVQTGRFRVHSAPFDLSALMQECLAAMSSLAERKGLTLHLTWIAGQPTGWVLGDAQRLRQITLNLLGNAVKYTDRGSVDLLVELTASVPNRVACHFTVSDTGPGIAPADQVRIFTPFTRLEQHRELAEGSGLGLSMVASLVQALGGTLRLESDGATGTHVNWTLDLALAPTPIGDMEKPPSAVRVLVADDNTLVRELLVNGLGRMGFNAIGVGDGETALATLSDQPAEIVILDISMPRLDGIETARRIRQREPKGRPALIVGLSAHAQEADIAHAKAAGMDRFLIKPVEIGVLGEVLADALTERTRPLHPEATGSDSLLLRLHATFDAEWPTLSQRLENAITTGDWLEFRFAAHYLKNSADVLGLDAIRLACLDAENTAHLRDARRAEAIFKRLRHLVAEARTGSTDSFAPSNPDDAISNPQSDPTQK